MEESLNDHGVLDEWFVDITKWSMVEQTETRRVWIAVYGVPMHGWTEDNFKEIAKIWGRLLRLEQEVDDTMNYECMRLLIDSDHFYRIQGDILLQIGNMRYRVIVSEIEPYVPSTKSFKQVNTQQVRLQHKVLAMEEVAQKPAHASTNSKLKNTQQVTIQHKVIAMEEVAQESAHASTNSKLKAHQDRGIEDQGLQGIQISNMEPS